MTHIHRPGNISASSGKAAIGILALAFLLASCATPPRPAQKPVEEPIQPPPPVPRLIMGVSPLSAERLAAFLRANNPDMDQNRARTMASLYVEESAMEGVNAGVAFAQMCVETGFLRFGGLVTPDMNNFCGLGSIGPGQPGNVFPDERTGVRAHVQHLKAYGSPEPLALIQVDPRYKYVTPKGKSPTVAGLAGTWAADPEYGNKILNMLSRLYAGS